MDEAPLYLDVADAPQTGAAYWTHAKDGTRLRFAHWPGTRAPVLILPGRGEYIEKYGRIVGRLAERGFGAVVIDWRNQGLADRKAVTGHVENFAQYRADMDAVMSSPVVQKLPQPFHVIAHSMGGLIALGALEAGLTARSVIFSAPMWGMGLNPILRSALWSLSFAATLGGLGTSKVLGAGRSSYLLSADPENNSLMACAETARWVQNQLKAHPDLALGGPSWAWLRASHAEIARLKSFELPDVPTLTLLGSDETVVSANAIVERCASPENGKIVVFAGARHEVLMECGAIQTDVWAEMDAIWSRS